MDTLIILSAQYLYLLVLLIAAVFFFMQSGAVRKSMAICGIIIAPVAYIIARIAGHFYYDPRPFVVGHFTPLIAHAADNGFPSDHALLTGVVAMIMFFYNKKLSAVLWILAIIVGGARVLSGIHHTADILGSLIIAILAGIIYYFSFEKRTK